MNIKEKVGVGVINPPCILVEPGLYKHFKGNNYLVENIATHSETGEKMVVYRADYGDHLLFVRPLSMFTEMVEVPHALPVPRFRSFTPEELEDHVATLWHKACNSVCDYILGRNDK